MGLCQMASRLLFPPQSPWGTTLQLPEGERSWSSDPKPAPPLRPECSCSVHNQRTRTCWRPFRRAAGVGQRALPRTPVDRSHCARRRLLLVVPTLHWVVYVVVSRQITTSRECSRTESLHERWICKRFLSRSVIGLRSMFLCLWRWSVLRVFPIHIFLVVVFVAIGLSASSHLTLCGAYISIESSLDRPAASGICAPPLRCSSYRSCSCTISSCS